MRLRGRFKLAKHSARRQARQRIIDIANGHRGEYSVRTYSMKNINEAVHVVRQHDKHGDRAGLLAAAGFNPKRRRQHDKPIPRYR